MIQPVASFSTTITSKITSTDTTIPIDKTTDDDGNSLDGRILGLCLDKGSATEETIIGTVDAANSRLITVTRGISVNDGTSSVAALKFSHRRKATIENTDHPYLVRVIRALNATDNLPAIPLLPADRVISDNRHVVDVEYLNDVMVAPAGIQTGLVTKNGADPTTKVDVGAGKAMIGDILVNIGGYSAIDLGSTDRFTYVQVQPEADGSASNILNNHTGFLAGSLPLATVLVAGGHIVSITDERPFLSTSQGTKVVSVDFTYGATLAVGDPVYYDAATSRLKKALATSATTADTFIGVVLTAGSNGSILTNVQYGGLVTGLSGLTNGLEVYLTDAGGFSHTPGTYKKFLGYAVGTTAFFLSPGKRAEDIAGGNAALTTANMNEMATFFDNTTMTGAQASTLVGGVTSDATALHTHVGAVASLNLAYGLVHETTNGFVMMQTSGFSDATTKLIAIGSTGGATNVLLGCGVYQISNDVGTAVSLYRLTTTTAQPHVPSAFIQIGSDNWVTTSTAGEVAKNESAVSFSGTAPSLVSGAGAPLAHDPTNGYLLIKDSTTRIRRYSGISGTTLTNIASDITLDHAVGLTDGFLFDNAKSRYICLDTANKKIYRFDSTGVSIDNITYTLADAASGSSTGGVSGLAILGGRIFLVVSRSFADLNYTTVTVDLVPTTMSE